jgi:hypothetical protein
VFMLLDIKRKSKGVKMVHISKKWKIFWILLGICPLLFGSVRIFIFNTWLIESQFEIESNSELPTFFESINETENDSYYLLDGVSYSKIFAGIFISNTDSEIIIQNCNFTSRLLTIQTDVIGGLSGISLKNVTNVLIINCLFSNFQDFGFYASNCANISIINSKFSGDFIDISLENCKEVTIVNSTFSKSWIGIWSIDSQNIGIESCNFSDISNRGISLSRVNGIDTRYNTFEGIKEEDIYTNDCLNWTHVV